jgi:hypothetical protein
MPSVPGRASGLAFHPWRGRGGRDDSASNNTDFGVIERSKKMAKPLRRYGDVIIQESHNFTRREFQSPLHWRKMSRPRYPVDSQRRLTGADLLRLRKCLSSFGIPFAPYY